MEFRVRFLLRRTERNTLIIHEDLSATMPLNGPTEIRPDVQRPKFKSSQILRAHRQMRAYCPRIRLVGPVPCLFPRLLSSVHVDSLNYTRLCRHTIMHEIENVLQIFHNYLAERQFYAFAD